MILCLDVGNSQIFGGVFDENEDLKLKFRGSSNKGTSSDEMGVFLRNVLRENDVDPKDITNISCCTVVPHALHSLRNCCLKYFDKSPFILQPGVKSGLKIQYRNPVEVGSDRIANAIAAIEKYPDKNLIIVDFGTATTFCAISKNKDYLGGVITAGLRISMEALEKNTARLPTVEILEPQSTVGRSTVESIQSGLYFGSLGLVREVVERITTDCFQDEKPVIIGTGGFSRMFENTELFDDISPDLVLRGLYTSLKLNL